MKVSEIKIKDSFKQTTPSEEKMKICRDYFKENGKLDRNIVVNKKGYLCDGYVGYLVLLENGVNEIEVICNQEEVKKDKVYVFGCHSGNDKEYVWRVPRNVKIESISVGSSILVQTRFGVKTVTVTRIQKLSQPPVTTPIKKVVRCLAS